MTKIYYDTEFHDTGTVIDLISIGMVDETGREYYAVNSGADWEAVNNHEWLRDNVLPHIPTVETSYFHPGRGEVVFETADHTATEVKPRWVIANEVRDFILQTEDPELWAYFSAHDHVALTQLWGPLMNAPAGIPWRTNDLMQEIERLGIDKSLLPPTSESEHNALIDAYWNKKVDAFLEGYKLGQRVSWP